MAYKPIQDYGIIGNLYTVAAIALDGSIDWFCFPNFDSPSVFGAILDHRKGGHYRISATAAEVTHKQFYWPGTNVLVTRFLSADGVGEVRDFMPIGVPATEPGRHWLVRRVNVVRGSMTFRVECRPAFNYARTPHQTTITPEGVAFESPDLSLGLVTHIPLKHHRSGVVGEFSLHEGETAVLVLREIEGTVCGAPVAEAEAVDLFNNTVEHWRSWLAKCTYRGRWREIVERSALTLKLLTYEPTGAIVAADGPEVGRARGVLAGVLAGLAALTRSIGVAAVVAIPVALWLRRQRTGHTRQQHHGRPGECKCPVFHAIHPF